MLTQFNEHSQKILFVLEKLRKSEEAITELMQITQARLANAASTIVPRELQPMIHQYWIKP